MLGVTSLLVFPSCALYPWAAVSKQLVPLRPLATSTYVCITSVRIHCVPVIFPVGWCRGFNMLHLHLVAKLSPLVRGAVRGALPAEVLACACVCVCVCVRACVRACVCVCVCVLTYSRPISHTACGINCNA